MERDLNYLKLLSKSFPSVQSCCTEIINLEAILHLPKGTEHFVTDLHGENEAFENVLRNASGVVRRKVEDIFGHNLMDSEKRELCALIYYPEEKLSSIKTQVKELDEWYRVMLVRVVKVLAAASSKYTRSKVRKALPKEYSYIIEELLHESQAEYENKHNYVRAIVETIVSTGRAEHFITAICTVIHHLVIDTLHIVGDIYDRGPGAHLILDRLEDYNDFDIQWGNHDLVWMGAASGSEACVATVLRMCFRYANLATLEDGYGINLLPLATFAMKTYKDDPCTVFMPKANSYESADVDSSQIYLIAQMHKAITVIQFKLEAAIIDRHPEFGMGDRKLLHRISEFELKDNSFPTIDPAHPYELTEEELDVITKLTHSFISSPRMAKHMRCLLSHGALYLVRNNNLLYHGSVPLNPDGSFAELEIQGVKYKGKALFDKADAMVRSAYYEPEGTAMKQYGQDFVWYLWCGPVSPPFDKDRMATFERYLAVDKALHKETKGNYYTLKNDPAVCDAILREFGIEDVANAHIINGHIPVKAIKGEDPVKAGGKLLVIDGGYSKAYQDETGIAGYTLIYNSQSIKLVQHEPFESRDSSVIRGADVISEKIVVEFASHRQLVRDTDKGRELSSQVDDLKQLLEAYKSGKIF
jgi:Uncharacterized protein conserved in bacteria